MASNVYNSDEFFQLIKRASRGCAAMPLWIGLVLVLLLAVGWLDIAVSVDLLIPLATTFRLVFAVGFWLLVVGGVAGLLVWPLVRRRRLEDVALRIERAVGNMHNRLLTVFDLHRAQPGQQGTVECRDGDRPDPANPSEAAGFHIQQLIDRMPLLKSLLGLAGVLGGRCC